MLCYVFAIWVTRTMLTPFVCSVDHMRCSSRAPADPCSRESVLKVLKESRKREVQDEDRSFTTEQRSKRRYNAQRGLCRNTASFPTSTDYFYALQAILAGLARLFQRFLCIACGNVFISISNTQMQFPANSGAENYSTNSQQILEVDWGLVNRLLKLAALSITWRRMRYFLKSLLF